jgi:hypothetical protein
VEQRPIQVFCDVCSRGVLVWKESMYRCPACGKQVCVDCFDRNLRKCHACAGPEREQLRLQRENAALLDEERRIAAMHARKLQATWGGILGAIAVVLGSALVTWLLLTGRCTLPQLPRLFR